jgi:L-malate glycosyltransferase
LNILEISSYFDPSIGGQEKHVLSLSQKLANLGHEVTVLTCGSYPKEMCKGFRVVNIPSHNFIGLKLISIPELKKIISQEKFDICHLHHSTIFGETILYANRYLKLPTVTTLHTQMNRNFAAKFFVDRLSLKWIGMASNKVICLSPIIKQSLIRRGLEDSKCVTIPNALEIEFVQRHFSEIRRTNNLGSEIDVLYVGRLEKRKGLQWLLEAIAILHNRGLRCRLQIIGHGPMLNNMRQKVKKENLEVYVNFSGYVSQEELLKSYLKAKVVVIPSTFEGLPTVALETMAANVPLIATDIPGLNELVANGKNGLIVPPKDSKSLASAIEKVLLSQENFQSLPDYNKRLLGMYSWDVVAKKIIDLYKLTVDCA